MPDVSDNGDIIYAGYTEKGYKIYHITKDEQNKVDTAKKYDGLIIRL